VFAMDLQQLDNGVITPPTGWCILPLLVSLEAHGSLFLRIF
jgi:hypothetical protein